jgi:magnesium chelatase subunit I
VNYDPLLDRFGMHAEIGTVKEPDLRVQIVEQRAAFDQAPVPFRKLISNRKML